MQMNELSTLKTKSTFVTFDSDRREEKEEEEEDVTDAPVVTPSRHSYGDMLEEALSREEEDRAEIDTSVSSSAKKKKRPFLRRGEGRNCLRKSPSASSTVSSSSSPRDKENEGDRKIDARRRGKTGRSDDREGRRKFGRKISKNRRTTLLAAAAKRRQDRERLSIGTSEDVDSSTATEDSRGVLTPPPPPSPPSASFDASNTDSPLPPPPMMDASTFSEKEDEDDEDAKFGALDEIVFGTLKDGGTSARPSLMLGEYVDDRETDNEGTGSASVIGKTEGFKAPLMSTFDDVVSRGTTSEDMKLLRMSRELRREDEELAEFEALEHRIMRAERSLRNDANESEPTVKKSSPDVTRDTRVLSRIRNEMRSRGLTIGQLFGYMDSDRSNRLSNREIRNGLATAGIHLSPFDIETLFSELNVDHDRFVSWKEFEIALKCSDADDGEDKKSDESVEDDQGSVIVAPDRKDLSTSIDDKELARRSASPEDTDEGAFGSLFGAETGNVPSVEADEKIQCTDFDDRDTAWGSMRPSRREEVAVEDRNNDDIDRNDNAKEALQVDEADAEKSSALIHAYFSRAANGVANDVKRVPKTKRKEGDDKEKAQRKRSCKDDVPDTESLQARLQTQLARLDAEIEQYEKERRAAAERKDKLCRGEQSLVREKEAFERWRQSQEEEVERWIQEQQKKIKRRRAVVERQAKALYNKMPDRQERSEIESLKETLEKEKLARRKSEKKSRLNIQRLESKVKDLEAREKQLRDEMRFLERERLKHMEEKERWEDERKALKRRTNVAPVPSKVEASTREVVAVETKVFEGKLRGDETNIKGDEISFATGARAPASLRKDERPRPVAKRPVVEFHESENRIKPRAPSAQAIVATASGDDDDAFEEKVFDDGKRERRFRDGRVEMIFRNGTRKVMSPDPGFGGSFVETIYFSNGDVKRTDPEGTVTYFYAAAKTTHTTRADGVELFEFPSGQKETHFKNGRKEISFEDGTRKTILPNKEQHNIFPDGTRVIEYPDGSKEIIDPDGARSREGPTPATY
eukprot:g1343.t1